MPNDAKLGLVLGVGLVVAFAVVFFRKEPGHNPADRTATAVPTESASVTARPTSRQAPGQVTAGGPRAQAGGRRHVVAEGDTLYTLARRYYKNDARFVDIYQANRHLLQTPDPLPPGTVLVLPDLPVKPGEETPVRLP